MPTAPKHPCNAPGCPALVERGVRFCADHKREQYRRFNATRGTVKEQGYGNTWRKLRNWHLSREPLCRECGKQGRTVAAKEVDHITPRRLGGTDEESNLQSLCRHHHSQKTAREVLNAR
jgi:5-methylcytosine-specific restriction protein A